MLNSPTLLAGAFPVRGVASSDWQECPLLMDGPEPELRGGVM